MRSILGIGLAGQSLSDLERMILREQTPYAVVLFGRNIAAPDQLRALVAEIKSQSKTPPVIMMDEEGGRVDRLRQILPGLPSVEAFGEGETPSELSEWHGRVIGMALRYFDIEINLAPVVDIRGEHAPRGLERRTFGADPETVVDLAGAFMRGHHAAGTGSCPKHFPGIGNGSGDSHYEATIIDVPLDELLQHDLVPFAKLANEAGAVMIGHGTYPQIDPEGLPGSVSRRIAHDVLRQTLGFEGCAVSDDMEMHAVSDLGSYESILGRALMAGNDAVLFCSHVERAVDLQPYLARRVAEDAAVRVRFDDAVAHCERYRAHCEQLRLVAGPPVASFEELQDEVARFVEEFQARRIHRDVVIPDVDRRQNERTPGKGRSGREEWT